jgi:hypothetical protein
MLPRLTAGIAVVSVSFLITHSTVASDSGTRAEVRLARTRVAPGDTTQLLVTFHLGEGIHINAEPPVDIEIVTPDSGVATIGAPVLAEALESGALDLTTPVRQAVSIPRMQPEGPVPLRVAVSYFYCSDEEGWCKMQTDTSSVSVIVTRH